MRAYSGAICHTTSKEIIARPHGRPDGRHEMTGSEALEIGVPARARIPELLTQGIAFDRLGVDVDQELEDPAFSALAQLLEPEIAQGCASGRGFVILAERHYPDVVD